MLFLTQSPAVYGIDALVVDIEVNLQPVKGEVDTSPTVLIVGLPDTAIRESRERIRAAIVNSSFFFPFHKTTINLAPADVRKEGASFDLPIALSILGATGDIVPCAVPFRLLYVAAKTELRILIYPKKTARKLPSFRA